MSKCTLGNGCVCYCNGLANRMFVVSFKGHEVKGVDASSLAGWSRSPEGLVPDLWLGSSFKYADAV